MYTLIIATQSHACSIYLCLSHKNECGGVDGEAMQVS